MILYEYPLNEGARTMLRLERLFARLQLLVARESDVDHHHALMTVFEVMELLARSDLKGDMMRELDRQRLVLQGYRENPAVAREPLEQLITQFSEAFDALNRLSGKLGAEITSNEWLMALRGRSAVPGGTFEFDAPGYHAWLHRPGGARRADLQRWTAGLQAVAQGVRLIMGLVRESGHAVRAAAPGGQFQQSLPQGKSYQLLRLNLDDRLELVPEITGHRLMVAVRFLKADTEGRLKPAGEDVSFEFALCS
ncbi:MAG: cell division protein ZapD [Betaproteobacteria bacterium]|nr:cell division protein ZapD [Betaproteobacteria bacterium]NBU50435.1 cell division protein ZapD [Betaproteobacteria bacterium]